MDTKRAGAKVVYHAQGKIEVAHAQEKTATALSHDAVATPDTESRIADMLLAYRILVNEGVFDSYGHLSVRSASNPKHFYMPRATAPGMVTRADIVELDVATGNPVEPNAPRTNGERFIHSEIYQARPDVNAIVHAHTMAVLPFSVAGVPLRPVMAQAGFLPPTTPIFEIRKAFPPNAKERGVLIRTPALGAAAAKALGKNPVVILRGHGMNVVADSMKRAVVQAVYTKIDAEVQFAAMQLNKHITAMDAKELAYNRIESFDIDRPWENFKNNLARASN